MRLIFKRAVGDLVTASRIDERDFLTALCMPAQQIMRRVVGLWTGDRWRLN